ncbi:MULTISPECIES: pyruvate kinase [Atopobiaceae]|uniref:Pyruvate kinase n=1 Tax=Parafannyhessea umbonata TaxID=604330 RepID=A0A1H9N5T3_9ACTN|nr:MULTISPECIES: pyruvate kinase [Atopobiaceae]SEH38047.1 pyruvate kinase [Parafannyhessea umbonata]SER31282.1 pyruvate kinase [Parafannyhessea umbonata]SJZ40684.1 pyruvate kinase [Olsenella sp. KH1P3]
MTEKRTKIVCTMGPATESDEVLRELIKAGMNVARFNFSHGSHAYHRNNIDRVRRISEELGKPVAILLDTKGPEIRTGELENHQKVTLETGKQVVVTTDDGVIGTSERFSLDYKQLPKEVEKGSTILIDDGLIELTVDHVEGNDMFCMVDNGGELGERKGVNVPNVEVGLPSVTEQDKADIMFGCELGIDAIAASFIRNGAAVEEIRQICADNGMRNVYIFPKIESAQGVKNFDEILSVSDGIMVARGDLGVEIPPAEVPHIQKEIIKKCGDAYKPVITATQMLDSMIRNPRPTRAEVNDVANAVYDGTDCVMLSGETAAGSYPVEAVKMMASICRETEAHLAERHAFHDRGGLRNVNAAIGLAAVEVADRSDAKCIICPTHSGRTARLISNFRPHLPIYAMSPSNHAMRKTCFFWGVEAFKTSEQASLSATCYNALTVAKEKEVVKTGDLVVITAGDPQTSPSQGDYITSTNMTMVSQIQ